MAAADVAESQAVPPQPRCAPVPFVEMPLPRVSGPTVVPGAVVFALNVAGPKLLAPPGSELNSQPAIVAAPAGDIWAIVNNAAATTFAARRHRRRRARFAIHFISRSCHIHLVYYSEARVELLIAEHL